MLPAVLRARGLVLAPDRRLLDGVDLDLGGGELVALDGQDGCGTSTLLRVLAGEIAPDAGRLEGAAALLGQPPGSDWDDGDVAGALADTADLVGLGMSSPPDRELWMLSAGERQRVRLARVLARPEPALLLDEPFGGLDGRGVRTVLDRLRAAADAGRGVLVVGKGDGRLAAAADRVLGLEAGRLQPVR